jgi:hypothetical protein
MAVGLVAYYQSVKPASAGLFGLSIGLGVVGFYAIVAPFLGLWLPRTRTEPIWQRKGGDARRRSHSQNPARRLPTPSPPVPPSPPGPATHAYLTIQSGNVILGHGIIPPNAISGDLPLRVEMDGLAGSRRGQAAKDAWVWSAPEVSLVNNSHEPIVFRVWLVARHGKELNRVERIRADVGDVRLEPAGSVVQSFNFVMPTLQWKDEEDKANPPNAWRGLEVVFLEVGTSRERRILFRSAKGHLDVPAKKAT